MNTNHQKFYGVNVKYVQQATDRQARRCILDCQPFSTVTVSAQQGAEAWATAIITLKKSNNLDGPWVACTGISTITAAAPFSDPISVTFRYLLADITTAEGSDSFINLDFSGKE